MSHTIVPRKECISNSLNVYWNSIVNGEGSEEMTGTEYCVIISDVIVGSYIVE